MAKRTLEDLQARYTSSKSAGGPGGPGRGPGGPGPRGGRGMGGKPKDAGKTVARLLGYLSPYKINLVFVLLFMLIRTGTSLAGSYMLRPIINNYIAVGKYEGFFYALLVLGLVYVCGCLATYAQNKIMLHVTQNAIEKLRNDLFFKLEGLPVRYFDSNTTGDIMSRFTNDVDNISTMLDNSVVSTISGVIQLVGTVVMMVYTNIWLTLITVAFTPLFLLGGKFIAGKSRRYYSAQQAALGAVNGYIEETVAGQKVIKVFNHEQTCEEEFEELNQDLRTKQMNAQFFGGIMGPVMGNVSKICYAFTAGIGGVLCALGKFDIGGLTIFVDYSARFSMPINELSQQVTAIFSALAGAERVFAVMDAQPETPDDTDAVDMPHMSGHVEFKDVTFGYVPDKIILKHISLYAKPGQKIAFVGSTGAGKTTAAPKAQNTKSQPFTPAGSCCTITVNGCTVAGSGGACKGLCKHICLLVICIPVKLCDVFPSRIRFLWNSTNRYGVCTAAACLNVSRLAVKVHGVFFGILVKGGITGHLVCTYHNLNALDLAGLFAGGVVCRAAVIAEHIVRAAGLPRVRHNVGGGCGVKGCFGVEVYSLVCCAVHRYILNAQNLCNIAHIVCGCLCTVICAAE